MFALQMTDRYQRNYSKKSLEAATAYLDDACNNDINTSITALSVTIELVKDTECLEADIALICSIVSCCPTLATLCIKTDPTLQSSAELQLSRALEQLGPSSCKPQIIFK